MSDQRRGAKALEEYIGDGGLSYPFPEDDPEYGGHLASAWLDGYDAGVSARPPADTWASIPKQWRHVEPGDTFVGRDKRLWHVTGIGPDGDRFRVDATHSYTPFTVDVDPDETINVLVLIDERDAIELCRTKLGAEPISRQTA